LASLRLILSDASLNKVPDKDLFNIEQEEFPYFSDAQSSCATLCGCSIVKKHHPLRGLEARHMTVLRRFVMLAVIALLVFAVFRWWRGRNGSATRITIAQVGDFFLYAPLYVAIDAGFFRDQGLEVSVVPTGGDDKTWAAVTSGSAQFGIADPTFVVASAERRQPGRVVASIVNGVPFWGVTLRADLRPISSASDLRGLRVATFPKPSTAYVLQQQMFNDAGVPPNIVQGAFGALLPMLRAGQADIALELEPNVSQAVADGAKVLYSMKDAYGDFAITGLTTTPEYIRDHSSTVRAVTCALQQSLDFIHKDQAGALAILARRFPGATTSVARAALQRVTEGGIVPSTVLISETAWRKAVDLRRTAGDFSDAGNFSTFVVNSFAENAVSNCRLR
jgi:NitT/TauT family transport system substrate-binding protein